MYSSCIYCSHHLGRNETLETFPVGELLAFDAWKGRLWAVCRRCHRWNLAPIEERWEAVEAAEQRFRATRLRVQEENVGIAQLPEGTRLIRVGEALPGELAAWRYGSELRERRRRYRVRRTVELLVGAVLPEALFLRVSARRKEVVHRMRGSTIPAGRDLLIRERDLRGTRIHTDGEEGLQILLPEPLSTRERLWRRLKRTAPSEMALSAGDAHDLLSRAMVRVNAPGAAEADLSRALELVDQHESVERILGHELGGTLVLAEDRLSLTRRLHGRGMHAAAPAPVPRPTMLAMEMLLHEELERHALAGELRLLRARWREAEEIASIADTILTAEDPDGRTDA
jgi:hypothetical protein